MEYFVLQGHDTSGPFSEEDLRRAFAGQRLNSTALVRPVDERHWTPLRKLLDQLDHSDAPPREPSIAEVLAAMAPSRSSRGPFEMIGANPLPAGLVGVAFAALLAFLSRWPLLVALPGLLLGVAGGIILIMRNRPLAGGMISLAAILLPIVLAPRAPVALAGPRETALASLPPASAPVELPPVSTVVTNSAPAVDVEPPKLPADVPLESPRKVEPSIPTVASLPVLPPVVERRAPAPPLSPAKSELPAKSAAPIPAVTASLPTLPEVVPVPASASPSRPDDLVFLVETGTGRGTGFLAADQGRVYFFTNLHVVSGAKKISARSTLASFDFKDGNIEVAADRDLVRFAVPAQPALQFGELPKVDDAVVALGNSGGREVVTRLDGKVLGVGPAQIEVSSEFIPGNSGGPLLDQSNRVLGVATYVLRGESVPDWIKAGTRFSTTRRFGVRVTEDVKWETMPLATLLRQTAILQTGEELLGEYITDINAIANRPFAQSLTTKFPDRPELRFFVDDYNRACREYTGRNHSINRADFIARLRDHVGKLSRGIRSTGQMVGRELGSASKGYAKEKETDLLKAFDEVATAIDKDERELFHF